ncbi:hypothetical protein F5051DRAFT_351812 [Lentinula edodes]|uniref:Uncharacterized protein n=1 Tax=Lentinula lateritia TaxID=40482 RepID=A0A9W9DLN3_9AGAR|nr:hypothetical protein F5051DRAFT_351812 [Lentinula edodes]KAJ4476368.1 hypothetical protein C8J55DRAFT_516685 [Lentinula edodes]
MTTTIAEPKFNRYKVQSTDVLQDARINVLEETSEQVIWFKERFLGDDEIIEHLIHNPTNTVCWIIHRPSQKGWYIRIRSPTFPPGVFIPLVPLPSKNPLHSDGALSFKSRTNLLNTAQTLEYRPPTQPVPNVSTSSVHHSYPPTPPPIPTVALRPPTPDVAPTSLSVAASASSSALLESKPDPIPKPPTPSSTTEFILAPATEPSTSTSSLSTARESLFSRAVKAFRFYEKDISSGYSFSLARVVVQSPPPYAETTSVLPTSSPPQKTSIALSTSPSRSSDSTLSIPTCIKALPVLTFTDLTSTFTVGSVNGILQLDKLEAEMLGVDPSFWVAVALTYLDFLEERGSYLASLGD